MWSLAREPVRRAIDDSLRQLEMGNPPVDIIDVRRKKIELFFLGGPSRGFGDVRCRGVDEGGTR